MEVKKMRKMIRKIFEESEPKDVGVFISMLSYSFIEACDITQKDFMDSLDKSLKLMGGNNDERNRKVVENKKD